MKEETIADKIGLGSKYKKKDSKKKKKKSTLSKYYKKIFGDK